ncbi:dUTP diphosphatase [Psychrobacillus sp. FSL K6-2843]|uniref:dUTP diphosphatase n=1 Tax=Psychrobacillus sp. FSL K6-2843 TaxID=2921549 RepID=UPI00315A6D2F
MNLTKLFETQRVLDERIMEKHPELKGQNNLDWKTLALQVELGECANEWRGFKKWSNDQESRTQVLMDNPDKTDKNKPWIMRNPLLEEYVDCLHFILSIGLELKLEDLKYNFAKNGLRDSLEAFRHVFNWAVNLDFVAIEAPFLVPKKFEKMYRNLFMSFVWLGEMLGFTWEQIEAAYYEKNEINHERQESGY